MDLVTSAFLFLFALATLQTTAPKVIPPPPDIAAPPADAVKTPSGLATKVIAPGTGQGQKNREGPGQQGPDSGIRRTASQSQQPGHRPLHRLDDRRQNVRQLRR